MNPALKFLRHQFQSLCSCKSLRQQTFARLCKECSSKINKLLLQTCLKNIKTKLSDFSLTFHEDFKNFNDYSYPLWKNCIYALTMLQASKQEKQHHNKSYRVKFKYNALKHFTFVNWEMLIFNIKWKRKFNIADLCDGAKALMNSVE